MSADLVRRLAGAWLSVVGTVGAKHDSSSGSSNDNLDHLQLRADTVQCAPPVCQMLLMCWCLCIGVLFCCGPVLWQWGVLPCDVQAGLQMNPNPYRI